MMKRTLTILIGVVVSTVLLVGCDSIALDEEEPTTAITAEGGLTTTDAFTALLNSTYDHLQGNPIPLGTGDPVRYGQEFMLYGDALADNAALAPGSGSGRYQGPLSNVQGAHLGPAAYDDYYEAINEANTIIANIGELEQDLPADALQAFKDRLRGEALFMRALNYFDLARTIAYEPGREPESGPGAGFTSGAIIRTEPVDNVADADFRSRASNVELYEQIEADLRQAIESLESAEASGTDLGATNPPRRISSAAAHGLLARVLLFHSDPVEPVQAEFWSAAAEQATAAINAANGRGISVVSGANLGSAWQSSQYPGSIFELGMEPGQDGAATNSNGALQALTDFSRQTFSFELIPSNDVLNLFSENDARNALFAQGSQAGSSFTWLQKYTGTLGSFADRLPLIRIEEMYLIRAEARAEQGQIGNALADLNTIRTNRGLDALQVGDLGSNQQQALIDSIYVERRRELLFEGHRFFDLKRRAMDIPKPQTIGELPYDDFRMLAPLPFQDVESNPDLQQNPGY